MVVERRKMQRGKVFGVTTIWIGAISKLLTNRRFVVLTHFEKKLCIHSRLSLEFYWSCWFKNRQIQRVGGIQSQRKRVVQIISHVPGQTVEFVDGC